MKSRVVVCDDDTLFQETLKVALADTYELCFAGDSDQALAILRSVSVDACLLDVQMRTQREGLDFLPLLNREFPHVPVLISSGLVDLESVRQAMQWGALDYVPKDAGIVEVKRQLQRILAQNKKASEASAKTGDSHVLVGASKSVEALRAVIRKAANSSLNVVITGEPGVGKEVVARMLGGGSGRPFVTIDSSTIHASTAESILFGYERGAFTGADKMRKGLFEEADGGSVYFDEVANMSMEIQAKLLRVIQEKEVLRLGGSKALKIDFRVIAATNRKIEDLISSGQFRFDLFSRLNVLPITIAPLRERKEDLPLLIDHFIRRSGGDNPVKFSPESMQILQRYSWPGNIRELENLIQFLSVMHAGSVVTDDLLPLKFRESGLAEETPVDAGTGSFYERVDSFERELLKQTYGRFNGNISRIARALRMDRSHLYEKLRRYAIHVGKTSSSGE